MSAYVALFLACLASGFVVPLPEDVPLIVAGAEVANGHLELGLVLLVGGLATLLRDGLAYGLGRIAGPRILSAARRVLGARLSHVMLRFEQASTQRQAALVFLTRFTPGVRVPGYFVAGLMDVPAPRFLALDAAGLLLTTPLLVWIGARWGAPVAQGLTEALAHQRLVILGVIVGAVGVLLLVRGRRG